MPRMSATWVASLTGELDVEAECAKLLAAVVGDLVRAPRRHPHPIDAVAVNEPVEHLAGLVFKHVSQRASRRRQRHIDNRVLVLVERDAVDEAEVDDVDPEFRVDHVAHRLLNVRSIRGGLGLSVTHDSSFRAWITASVKAIHPNNAHLMRAGYLPTPTKAVASPSRSSRSSSSASPLDCIRSRKASMVCSA